MHGVLIAEPTVFPILNPFRMHPTNIGEAGDIERVANLLIALWDMRHDIGAESTAGEVAEYEKLKKWDLEGLYAKILKNRAGAVGGFEMLSYNRNQGKIGNTTTSGPEWASS